MRIPTLKEVYFLACGILLAFILALQVMNGYVIYTVYTHIMSISPRRQSQLDSLKGQNEREILMIQKINANVDMISAKINDHTNTINTILEKQKSK